MKRIPAMSDHWSTFAIALDFDKIPEDLRFDALQMATLGFVPSRKNEAEIFKISPKGGVRRIRVWNYNLFKTKRNRLMPVDITDSLLVESSISPLCDLSPAVTDKLPNIWKLRYDLMAAFVDSPTVNFTKESIGSSTWIEIYTVFMRLAFLGDKIYKIDKKVREEILYGGIKHKNYPVQPAEDVAELAELEKEAARLLSVISPGNEIQKIQNENQPKEITVSKESLALESLAKINLEPIGNLSEEKAPLGYVNYPVSIPENR